MLNLRSSRQVSIEGPRNSETEVNHTEWSEHKSSYVKTGHGG